MPPNRRHHKVIIAGVRPELGSGSIKLLNAIDGVRGGGGPQNDIGVAVVVDFGHIIMKLLAARHAVVHFRETNGVEILTLNVGQETIVLCVVIEL